MNVWLIAWKEWKTSWNVPMLVYMLATPVLLMLIMGTVLSGNFNGSEAVGGIRVLYAPTADEAARERWEAWLDKAEAGVSDGDREERGAGDARVSGGERVERGAGDALGSGDREELGAGEARDSGGRILFEEAKNGESAALADVRNGAYTGYVTFTENGMRYYGNDRASIENGIVQGVLASYAADVNLTNSASESTSGGVAGTERSNGEAAGTAGAERSSGEAAGTAGAERSSGEVAGTAGAERSSGEAAGTAGAERSSGEAAGTAGAERSSGEVAGTAGAEQSSGEVAGAAGAERSSAGVQERWLQAPLKPSAIDYYAIAVTTMIIMYIAASAGLLFENERVRHTANRLLVAPVSKAQIFAGKIAGSLVVYLVFTIAIVLISKYMYGANWGDANDLAAALLVLASQIVFSLSLGLGISYLFKSKASGAIIMTIIQLATFFGGSYYQNPDNGDFVSELSRFSPLDWTNDALIEIIYGSGSGLAAGLDAILLNGGFSVLLLAVSIVLMRRKEGL